LLIVCPSFWKHHLKIPWAFTNEGSRYV